MTTPQTAPVDAALESVGYHIAWLRWNMQYAHDTLVEILAQSPELPDGLRARVLDAIDATGKQGDDEAITHARQMAEKVQA